MVDRGIHVPQARPSKMFASSRPFNSFPSVATGSSRGGGSGASVGNEVATPCAAKKPTRGCLGY